MYTDMQHFSHSRDTYNPILILTDGAGLPKPRLCYVHHSPRLYFMIG
jgi:hypothetical protein